MNSYEFTRAWFDFAFENTDVVSGNHTGVYLWNVELNNRLGWVKKFASPASQAMMANGIKSYNTYKKIFSDLVQWGFIEVVQESKNQHSACIIALSNFDKALDNALDKALTTHLTKQGDALSFFDNADAEHLTTHLTTHLQRTVQSTCQSSSSIIKPINQQTNKPINEEEKDFSPPSFVRDELDELRKKIDPPELRAAPLTLDEYEVKLTENRGLLETTCMSLKISEESFRKAVKKFFADKRAVNHQAKNEQDITQHFMNWSRKRLWEEPDVGDKKGKLTKSVEAAARTASRSDKFLTFDDLNQ
ncbi:hypothetical protein LZD49_26265 [Dyadobacter sp. CY261]|uniref:DUF7833 domain-containing protein n=1 Tax=Dyadobacter sp. CY261 TaxID=2907203 RepID=UPI001F2F5EC0|nr:hypothetical protein [Dyadobacter sp. CY261]MCF0074014.1 hypothetical protein [Dyadobacter sp. CY261]